MARQACGAHGERRPQGYFFVFPERHVPIETAAQPVGRDKIAIEEKQYQTAEEMRLIYVAATRPRNMLISHYDNVRGDNRAWSVLDDATIGIPELEIPPGKAIAAKEKVVVKEGELERARQDCRPNLRPSTNPATGSSVTAVAKEGAEIRCDREPDRA